MPAGRIGGKEIEFVPAVVHQWRMMLKRSRPQKQYLSRARDKDRIQVVFISRHDYPLTSTISIGDDQGRMSTIFRRAHKCQSPAIL